MARKTSFALRLAAIPILLALIGIIEARQPLATFRLVAFGVAFVLLADIASLLRDKWRDFLVVLASLAFGMFIIESVANIWGPPERIVVSPDGFYARRFVIGARPGHPGQFHAEKTDPRTGGTIYSVNYTIDSNLLRQTQSCETGPAVVFFGCSFTFGTGLNDDQTLPQQFANGLDRKVRVLNLGFIGYGPQQFLSELQTGVYDSVIGLHPKLFVILTSVMHADRSACKPHWEPRGPRYMIENGRLILKGACYEGFSLWLQEWLQHSAAYSWLIDPYRRRELTPDDIELYIQITLAAVNLAKSKYGAPVIVLYFGEDENSLRGTGFTNVVVMQRLRDGGAIVVDTSLRDEAAAEMAVSIPGDGHPTALANRMRASILKDYLERNMPEVLASRPN